MIVDYGCRQRLDWGHATKISHDMSPSHLYDGVFSRGFSLCRRRSRTVSLTVIEILLFSLMFPGLSYIFVDLSSGKLHFYW